MSNLPSWLDQSGQRIAALGQAPSTATLLAPTPLESLLGASAGKTAAKKATEEGLLSGLGGPAGMALAAGTLLSGIFKARAAKKMAEAESIQRGAAEQGKIAQQGVAQQNAAIESLMRKL